MTTIHDDRPSTRRCASTTPRRRSAPSGSRHCGSCCSEPETHRSRASTRPSSATSCPTPRCSRRSAAATRSRSPTCTTGERVLDLGSGGGIDVLLSAKRVGPTGRAFGLDMTDEMLALARRNAAEAGATNVEFLKGHIEAIPLPADSIDVVISNCVVNLAADKPAVFREIARVLRPGGRIGITRHRRRRRADAPSSAPSAARYAGCIAGALSFSEFATGLEAVGLTDVSITPTHAVADGMISAIIKATKDASARPSASLPSAFASAEACRRRRGIRLRLWKRVLRLT